MSDDERQSLVIVDGVSKDFRLPHEKNNSLKTYFLNPINIFRHRSIEVQHALRDITFDVKDGEFFGIVGRNGSGKSTLLKILAGIYQPTRGKVHVAKRIVPFIELGVGFNPELTGRENVYLSGALLGFSTDEIDQRYDSIVKFAELEKFMDQKLKNYSSGMQVRLAFSITIQADADILLIDEVLAVGDTAFQRKCFDYFKQLKRDQKTIIFVTHDMEAVRQYCDRAILIDKSKILVHGDVTEATVEYEKLNQRVNEKELKKTKNQGRWGDGALKISNVTSDKDFYSEYDPTWKMEMTLTATKDIEDVVVGFNTTDQLNRKLFGVNNVLLDSEIPTMKAGESLVLTWECENVLNDGVYTILIEARHAEGVGDSWPSALQLSVGRSKTTGFLVVPKTKLSLKKEKK